MLQTSVKAIVDTKISQLKSIEATCEIPTNERYRIMYGVNGWNIKQHDSTLVHSGCSHEEVIEHIENRINQLNN